jgi:hypothetical protein
MNLADIIAKDFKTIEADLGTTIEWQGETYPCGAGSNDETLILTAGGNAQQADLVINVRKSLFGEVLPLPQQKIQYKGETFRIATVKTEPTGALVKLICVSAKRGV